MKNIRSLAIMLIALFTLLSACAQAPITPVPTVVPRPTMAATAVPVPTLTASPTPDALKTAIEAAWAVQKPLIDAAVATVFTGNVSSPWLSPIMNITTLTADSPAAHCQAMKLWDNFIRVPDFLPDCRAGHDPINDYFGIIQMSLQTKKDDNFILRFFAYRPIPFCDSKNCIFLPAPGWARYGMGIGSYQVVTVCGKPTGTPTIRSIYTLLPYLKDPVSMIIHDPKTDIYIEFIVNRDAWFSLGWESGAGWSETYRVCPTQ